MPSCSGCAVPGEASVWRPCSTGRRRRPTTSDGRPDYGGAGAGGRRAGARARPVFVPRAHADQDCGVSRARARGSRPCRWSGVRPGFCCAGGAIDPRRGRRPRSAPTSTIPGRPLRGALRSVLKSFGSPRNTVTLGRSAADYGRPLLPTPDPATSCSVIGLFVGALRAGPNNLGVPSRRPSSVVRQRVHSDALAQAAIVAENSTAALGVRRPGGRDRDPACFASQAVHRFLACAYDGRRRAGRRDSGATGRRRAARISRPADLDQMTSDSVASRSG